MTPPAVSIVTVTWNSEQEIADLLVSVDEHLVDYEVEVVVVDNASSDATVEAVEAWPGRKRLIRLDENRGFGAAANVGVREASCEAVVLINPDTVLVDDSLVALADLALQARALCGPELLNPNGSRQPSASAKPGGWEVAATAIFPAGSLPRRVREACEPWRAHERTEVGWLTGACIAAPKQLLTRLGPFYEGLDLYGEDMDLGLRARRGGVRSIYAPDVARVIHVGERSTTKRFGESRTARKLANRRIVVGRLFGPLRERIDHVGQLLFHTSRFAAKATLRRDARRERLWLEAASNGRRNGDASSRLTGRDLRRFAREASLLLAALGVFNASNYVFHVVVSRLLGPAEYGGLAALLAVVMVMSVPLGALHTAIAQRTAALRAQGRGAEVATLATGALKALMPLSILATVLVLGLVSPLLAAFLHLDLSASLLLGPYVLLSVLASVPLGVLQGEQRFGAVATVMLAGVGFRLGLGIGLVAAGFGIEGAVLATALAPLASLLIGLRQLNLSPSGWRRAQGTLDPLRGAFGPALVALTSFWLLAEADLAIARHFLADEEAGYYSSAGLLARALLFLPAAVAIVAFPRFVAARERGEGQAAWLRSSLIGVSALVGAALPVLLLFPEQTVSLAFGDEYGPAAQILPLASLAMALLAVVGLLVYFHIAIGTRAHRLVVGAVAAEVALLAFLHDSGRQMAAVVVVVAAVTLLLQLQTAISASRWRPAAERARKLDLVDGIAAPATLDVSVVVPCHNAAAGLIDVLPAILEQLTATESFEVIVVSDGSTDDSVRVAEGFSDAGVRVIEYPLRGGKGQALRAGLKEARGEYVAFFDADGDIGAEAIGSFLALMRLYEPDVVLGSKRHALSQVHYPATRRLLSWAYHRLSRLLFRIEARDTQTGCKLIRREVLAAVLPRLLEKRYAFDLEFLVVARALGYRRTLEAPVRIDYRFRSHVSPGAALRIGLDTAAIFYRHHILDTYRKAGRQAAAAERVLHPVRISNGSNGKPSRNILVLNWKDIRHPEAGGAEIFTHEVARRWVAKGHSVTLLSSSFREAAADETLDGVRIRRFGRLRNGSFHLLVQRELHRARDFDVVVEEINTAPFLTALWRRRLPPVVVLIHQLARDVLDAELSKPLAAVGRWLEPRALGLYRDLPIVTVSASTKEDLEQLGLKSVCVVPEGVDAPPVDDLPAKEPRPTFLFAGRLAANKRPDHAVAAFRAIQRRLPDAQLWIIGRGPLERSLARELPDRAELLGYVPRRELFERMARAHCLLVPSVREGWGLVVLEANAAGTPAVGYRVPGVRDSIRDGRTGLLAGAGNPGLLAESALSLLHDDEHYQRIRAAALEWAGQFSWDRTADSFMDAIELAITGVEGAEEKRLAAAATV